MRKVPVLALLAAAGFAAAGCTEPFGPDSNALTLEESQLVASELDAIGNLVDGDLASVISIFFAFDEDVAAAAVPVNETLARTRPCPAGGTVTLTGTITGTRDREARSLSTTTSATKTAAACAITNPKNNVTITVNGNPNIAFGSTRNIVNGQLSGIQTTFEKGGFTWSTSDGRSGSCAIDVKTSFDPATRSLTITGTTCQRRVNLTSRGRSRS
jgi:hypothetical protein